MAGRCVTLLNGTPRNADEVDTSAARLLGLTVFETVAVAAGRPRQRDAHLERLRAGADTLALAPDGGWPALEHAIDEALAAWGPADGVLRVSLHPQATPKGLDTGPDGTCDVLVRVTEPRYPGLGGEQVGGGDDGDGDDEGDGGVAVVTSSTRAPDPASWPSHVKAPCLPRLMAYREAHAAGAFEALLLDASANVVSGSRANLFAVLQGRLVTPPTPPAFPGITRARVLDAGPLAGHEVTQAPLPWAALGDADELFLTLTGPGIVPVTRLDGRPVGAGQPGPATTAVRAALASLD